VREQGIESFKQKIDGAQNLFDYKLGILKTRHNFKDIDGKAKIAASMLETINKFKNAVLKSEYIKKLAQELDVLEDALLQEARKIHTAKPLSEHEHLNNKKELNINPTEKLLIKLMFEEKELVDKIRHSLEPADFRDERASRIVSVMFDLLEQGKNIEPNLLMNYFSEEDISSVVCESVFLPEVSSQNKEKVIDDCIKRLRTEKIKFKKQHLHDQIKVAQESRDEEKLNRLVEEFHDLTKKR
jgi:DNA primase